MKLTLQIVHDLRGIGLNSEPRKNICGSEREGGGWIFLGEASRMRHGSGGLLVMAKIERHVINVASLSVF